MTQNERERIPGLWSIERSGMPTSTLLSMTGRARHLDRTLCHVGQVNAWAHKSVNSTPLIYNTGDVSGVPVL